MYLKEIEIFGFKSFADKININLDNNITCVVGPNGSGKSNIVDAIRWVLGEQSVKSLRGENNMTDVIFSGSKKRNPLNVASVMLTFDNSDNYLNLPYNSVSIKRRAYRTGENEYFLNGEKCRLKDITELFLDTGVGKSSFNIISQGEISRILSNSALERRSVIEEAASVIKYKTRREEALRKLDRTLNNITRVNDIISELETRVEPLRKQSIEAKNYLEVKNKLKEIEVALLAYEIGNINNKYQENKKRIETINEEIIELNTKISNNSLEEEKIKSIELEKDIATLNNRLIVLTREEEEINSKRKMLQERSKYDANDLKIHENLMLLKERKLSLNSQLSLLNNDIFEIDSKIEVSKKNIATLINTLSDMKVKKDNLNREYLVKNKEELEIKNKIMITEDNLENNLSISSNVKRVLNNPRLSGIYDAFGNILNTEKEYSKALEVIIAGSKNFIIVENELSAKEAIEFLKNNNLGRCTFFPLSVIKPKGIDYETYHMLDEKDGFIGLLSDYVTYDEKYKNIVLNQLGNIILCKDLDSGNKISKLINNKYRLVTLDGEIIHVGGSITGGSVNNSLSPISLKKELESLKLQEINLKMVNENLIKSINNLDNSIISMEEEVYNARSEYVDLEENKKNYLTSKNQYENNLKSIEEEINSLELVGSDAMLKEEEQANQEYYAKKEEKVLLEKELLNKNRENDKIKGNILNLEGQNKTYNSNLREKEKILKDLEIEISRMDTKLDNDLEILNSEYEMTYEKASSEYMLDLEFDEAKKIVLNYKNQLKNIGMVNIHAIEEFDEVNTRYEFLTNQRNDLLNAKDTLNDIIKEMDDIMKEDFLKTFNILQEEFKKVFQMLFKGGTATLKLTNPDDLLTTGVDIIAEPPGKSLKAISLLSGGEKTLTAISLLFAILNIRKVPFCVFDEIEAALDENNVDVFGHYLDNYKDKTQFLLITHKKRTMEYAKTLYGITMQESGVSKLVSVKLEN